MIFLCLYLFSNLLFSQNIDITLEKNISEFKKGFGYYLKSDVVNLSETGKNNKYRLRVVVSNDTKEKLCAIILRYSLKLTLRKNNEIIHTVSLFSSSLRISQLDPLSSKNFYIYDINNLFTEIKKFMKTNYIPVSIIVEMMREPKKGQELLFYTKSFDIVIDK
jgi:hypothetical protein